MIHMKLFIDSLDLPTIAYYNDMGILAGVTTNPTMQKEFGFKNDLDMILKLREVIGNKEIHVEAFGRTADEILKNSDRILSTGKNLVFKIPFSKEGVYATHRLTEMQYKTSMHLVFSLSQAIIASVVAPTYMCPLIGRLDDSGQSGMEAIAPMIGLGPKIIVSSVRHPQHVMWARQIGADAVTIPPDVLNLMFDHPLTERGINIFEEDIKFIRGKKHESEE